MLRFFFTFVILNALCSSIRVFVPSCLLTSHHDGSGLLGWVPHVVAGHAAVDPRLVWADGRESERAPLHHAPLWQAVITAHPSESRGRLSARGDAHQGYRLAGIHHDRILHQQLDGRRGCGGRARRVWLERLAEDGQLWQMCQSRDCAPLPSFRLHVCSTFIKTPFVEVAVLYCSLLEIISNSPLKLSFRVLYACKIKIVIEYLSYWWVWR